jgi:predicted SAM-dependent methyltransferase
MDTASALELQPAETMKLNIGCGTDYRDGFINIDGSDTLPRLDKKLDIRRESLLSHFDSESVTYILANDIIEHHYHWEAVRILREFHCLLTVGGTAEIRVPDAEWIIKTWRLSVEQKLNLLFGGQDIPQRRDEKMDESRKKFPQYFCHKFGWTIKRMTGELAAIGFTNVRCVRAHTNFVTYAERQS